MKKTINIKAVVIYIGLVLIGGIAGYLINTSVHQKIDKSTHRHIDTSNNQTWTCSMHPQIKKDEPGQCPICGMDLIPMDDGSGNKGAELSLSEIKMSKSAIKIAQVQTVFIEKTAPYKEVYFPGKIKPDERNISELTARFGGRIEKLYINFTGQKVSKGQKLASIYSPDLVTAQRELFEAVKYKENNIAFYQASRNKLKLWDLTEKQIDGIESTGEPIFYFDVLSPISGTVTMRHIAIGDYIKEGSPLFEVINLNHLWVMFEAYESDIPWVKLGDKIDFTIKSIPGKVFKSTVTFIDPVIDPKKRVVYVRTELNNTGNLLKPEMFTSGILKTMLPNNRNAITVPKSAILWTGKRAIVYIKVPNKEMVFEHREIELGEDAGLYYVVKNGLEEGEEVVTNGVFKVDAASQLQSKQSMMTPAGGKSSMGGHAGMDMGDNNKKKDINMNMPMPNKHIESKAINQMFKKQLGEIVIKYLHIKDAFTIDDVNKVIIASKEMKVALKNVDMKLLNNQTQHMNWMNASNKLSNTLDKIIRNKDIESQRIQLIQLSDVLINTIQTFGISMTEQTLYLDYCPMANDRKGGFWLSADKEINNPYFGQKMHKCGEVKHILNK